MDGILYVRGPAISTTSSALITMASSNQFAPWITVLNRGATIAWSNQIPQAQDVRTTPGYGRVNPQPFAVHVAAGGAASVTLDAPGVYDYYASGATTLNPAWQRAAARTGANGYPVAMEGVIAILDY
jgi:hypothetical protein